MGNRLLDLREENKLRQEDVAESIGITQRKYSYIETGTQLLSEEIIIKLSDFYKVSSDYILKLTDVKEPYPRNKK